MGGIDLWLVAAGGEEVLVAQDIDASCPVRKMGIQTEGVRGCNMVGFSILEFIYLG